MIREAAHADIGTLLLLAEAMHAESKWRRMHFDLDKTAALFRHLIDHPTGCVLVAERDGEVIGGMAGWCDEHFFSRDKFAGEFGVFVKPTRRGGLAAAGLLKAFHEWAKSQGAAFIEVGITTGVHVERSAKLYEALGFQRAGVVFEAEV
ncbi:MAG TPA: GNAT family N-acetyltransferase [Rhodanobacteraceae bacterium]|nr:GNAT family N-acetyltransferase [Rhodanobacteraceae bacterium]